MVDDIDRIRGANFGTFAAPRAQIVSNVRLFPGAPDRDGTGTDRAGRLAVVTGLSLRLIARGGIHHDVTDLRTDAGAQKKRPGLAG